MEQKPTYSVIHANELHRKSLISLLDRAFEYQAPQSYAIDFAPCFATENLKNLRALLVNETPVACGYMITKAAVHHDKQANIAVIGAIATHPEHRGKGYSSKIIQTLLADADSDPTICGSILWSDNLKFYSKFNFSGVGVQHLYDLSQLTQHSMRTKLSDHSVERGWPDESIQRLYDTHSTRVLRSAADWTDQKLITSCERFCLMSPKGDIVAYLGAGRGNDMVGVIHEWGGEREELVELVRRLLLIAPGLLWLTSPILREDPISALCATAGIVPQSMHMGLFRPTSHESAAKSIIDPAALWFWGRDSL